MTQDHVAGFASELVKMAQAVERVPQLEATIRRLETEVWNANAAKTDMYSELEQSRTYAAGLEQRIHDAEVARDDAELRFLEVDDAKDTLVRVLDNLGKDIIGALQAVAPQPVPDSQRPHEVPEGYQEIPRPEGGFDAPHYEKIPTEVSPAVMETLSVDAPLAGQSEDRPIYGNAATLNDTGEQSEASSVSTAGQSEADPTSSALSPTQATSADVVEPAHVSDAAVASSTTGEGVSVPTDPTSHTASIEASPETSPLSPNVEPKPAATKDDASTGEGDTPRPFAPPAQPIEGSPPAQSSDTSTGDEPSDKYSPEWYRWVDAVPARRLRILGY